MLSVNLCQKVTENSVPYIYFQKLQFSNEENETLSDNSTIPDLFGKVIFIEVGVLTFWERQAKNMARTRKISNFCWRIFN